MQNISTYKRYLNKQIEFINHETLVDPAEYELTFPHSYDSSWTYKNIFIQAVKSQDFTGGVRAELLNVITDSLSTTYEKQVIVQQIDNSAVNITMLDENTTGTYRMLDNSADKLIIRVTQTAPGTGKVIFVLRGL